MRSLGAESASSRRTILAVLFAGLAFSAVNVQAQDAPAPAAPPQDAAAPAQEAPAQPAAPAEDPFRFTSDAALIIWYVKPDQTAAFERVWGTIRGRLAASDNPELRELGESLSVFRADAPATEQGVTYFFVANPVTKSVSYSPSPFLLFEAGLFTEDAEARELFNQLNAAINNISPLPLDAAAAPIAAPPPSAAEPAAPAAPTDPAAPATPPTP